MNPKVRQLLRLGWDSPAEFYVRMSTFAERMSDSLRKKRSQNSAKTWDTAVDEMDALLGGKLRHYLNDVELVDVEQSVFHLKQTMPQNAPFGAFHNGDLQLAHLCYALARILQPLAIVETGVCYGVTSAFLLQALRVNGRGVLHSIDLPPLGKNADQFVGRLIPADLRGNWTLHRGSSKSLLPAVLQSLGKIDLFVHDSLHTYRNMRREFETVQTHLSPNSAVIADDIEGNEAFHEWTANASPQYSVTLREQSKAGLAGVALFRC